MSSQRESLEKLYEEGNYDRFIREASKYLSNNRNDRKIRFFRAKAYRNLEMYDEAIVDLEYLLSKRYNKYALGTLFFIYYQERRYEEAFDLLKTMYENNCLRNESIYIAELVIRKALGMKMDPSKEFYGDYITMQLFDYSEEFAVEHIKQHYIFSKDHDNTKSSFNEDINIDTLFQAVKQNLKSSKKVNTDEVLDRYYYSIPNVGINGENIYNFLKVIVEPNTYNIINMYPVDKVDYEYLEILNCDYGLLFRQKQKSLSQINKFYKRYGIV